MGRAPDLLLPLAPLPDWVAAVEVAVTGAVASVEVAAAAIPDE